MHSTRIAGAAIALACALILAGSSLATPPHLNKQLGLLEPPPAPDCDFCWYIGWIPCGAAIRCPPGLTTPLELSFSGSGVNGSCQQCVPPDCHTCGCIGLTDAPPVCGKDERLISTSFGGQRCYTCLPPPTRDYATAPLTVESESWGRIKATYR